VLQVVRAIVKALWNDLGDFVGIEIFILRKIFLKFSGNLIVYVSPLVLEVFGVLGTDECQVGKRLEDTIL